ncbi:MAG: hypothetical protein IPM57_07490 [Oligoflexia bacterium]|nr:hypothetical protein [Oligoflexia bacterium]
MLSILFFVFSALAHKDDFISFKALVSIQNGNLYLTNTKNEKVYLKQGDYVEIINQSPLVNFNEGLSTFKRTWSYDRDVLIRTKNNDKIYFSIPGARINFLTADYSVHKDHTSQQTHIVREAIRRPSSVKEVKTSEACHVLGGFCANVAYNVKTGYTSSAKESCAGSRDVLQKVSEFEFVRTWHIYNEQGEILLVSTQPEIQEEIETLKVLSRCVRVY